MHNFKICIVKNGYIVNKVYRMADSMEEATLKEQKANRLLRLAGYSIGLVKQVDERHQRLFTRFPRLHPIVHIVILALCLLGCTGGNGAFIQADLPNGTTARIITVDRCEYLLLSGLNKGLVHKGNCSNPSHK